MSFKIEVFSHHFAVSGIPKALRPAVEHFKHRFVQYGLEKERGVYVRRPVKLFAASVLDGEELRFHINCLNGFKRAIERAAGSLDVVEFVYHPINHGFPVDIPIFEDWVLRENQIAPMEYLDNNDDNGRKFLELQTGYGKGLLSMMGMSHWGRRTLIVVKPMYLTKWRDELFEKCDISVDDLIIVRGTESLVAVLEAGMAGTLNAKIILVSNRTMYFWFKAYEESGAGIIDNEYPCLPHQMCQVLGIGMRLIDETHQDFHFNFKLDLYTHVSRSISLSATLLSNDDFIKNIYAFAYPVKERFANATYDKYISTYAVFYRFKKPEKISTTIRGRSEYNHIAFEESVSRHVPTCRNYIKMILDTSDRFYRAGYKPGYKLLVFCGSVAFCSMLRDAFTLHYPHLTVGRFVDGDPEENLHTSDIVISTLLSAGTARDIDGLSVVLQTTAIVSDSANVQSLGRLRKPKDGSTPIFVYFNCSDIDKHIEYHQRKMGLFNDRVKELIVQDHPSEI